MRLSGLLNEGADPALLKLQQQLADDLDDRIDVSLQVRQGERWRKNEFKLAAPGEQYIELNLQFPGDETPTAFHTNFVYLSSTPDLYSYGPKPTLYNYEELVDKIEEDFMYWLQALDRQKLKEL